MILSKKEVRVSADDSAMCVELHACSLREDLRRMLEGGRYRGG